MMVCKAEDKCVDQALAGFPGHFMLESRTSIGASL